MAREHGFDVLKVSYPSGHFTVDYLAERLVKSARLGLGYRRLDGVRGLLRRVTLPVNLRDIMLLEARRRP